MALEDIIARLGPAPKRLPRRIVDTSSSLMDLSQDDIKRREVAKDITEVALIASGVTPAMILAKKLPSLVKSGALTTLKMAGSTEGLPLNAERMLQVLDEHQLPQGVLQKMTRPVVEDLAAYDLSRKFFRGIPGKSLEKVYSGDALDYRLEQNPQFSQAPGPYTLTRGRGDASNTKVNSKGGFWVSDNPKVASTYPASTEAAVVPLHTKPPDVILDATGQNWDDFWKNSKLFREHQANPESRVIEVRNIYDVGPKMDIEFPDAEDVKDMLSNLRFIKKHPTDDLPVISSITKSSFPYAEGGSVSDTLKKFIKRPPPIVQPGTETATIGTRGNSEQPLLWPF